MIGTKGPMNSVLVLLLTIFLLYMANVLERNAHAPSINVSVQDYALNVDNSFYNLLHLGNKRMISGLLWVQTLLESDLDQYNKKDLNSWMFLRFNSIIDLDPNFYQAYYYGGLYLSVIKNDALGAAHLFEKGTAKFPDDFSLNYYAGLHSYFEIKDPVLSLKYLSRTVAGQKNKKKYPHLVSLIARLKASMGDLNTAYQFMMTAWQNAPDGSIIKEKFYNYLYSIRAEIDLNCLNLKKSNCRIRDLDNNLYKKSREGKYTAPKKWKQFTIKKN